MTAEPERLAIVVRLDAPDGLGEPRYALVRTLDDGPLALLDAAAPASRESIAEVVADAISARLGVGPVGEALACAERRPRRAANWREGRVGVGWVRAVAVAADAVLDPGPALAGVEALPLADAEAALPTSLDRALLRDGAALLAG